MTLRTLAIKILAWDTSVVALWLAAGFITVVILAGFYAQGYESGFKAGKAGQSESAPRCCEHPSHPPC